MKTPAQPGHPCRPAADDESRPLPDDAFAVAQGARALTITVLVHVALIATALAAPSGYPSWALVVPFFAYAYVAFLVALPALILAGLAACGFVLPRLGAQGEIIPFGTIGEARLVLAILAAAVVFSIPDAPYAQALPFPIFLTASMLCALADGFWIAAVMRQRRCTFLTALCMILREAWNPQAGTWRIVTGGRP